jgi:hypothetical protein
MKTLSSKNQENPSDRISHTWAPLICYPITVMLFKYVPRDRKGGHDFLDNGRKARSYVWRIYKECSQAASIIMLPKSRRGLHASVVDP